MCWLYAVDMKICQRAWVFRRFVFLCCDVWNLIHTLVHTYTHICARETLTIIKPLLGIYFIIGWYKLYMALYGKCRWYYMYKCIILYYVGERSKPSDVVTVVHHMQKEAERKDNILGFICFGEPFTE